MFDSVFIFKVFLSFLTGGFFTTITLYAAEKYGPKLGGILAGLPSTTAVGLFFIGYTQSAQAASQAATLMPAAVGGSLIFVIAYVTLCRRTGYKLALLIASVVWLMIALPLAYSRFEDMYTATLFFLAVWIVTLFYMRSQTTDMKMPEKISYTKAQMLWRAVFAGALIASAVVISSLFGPLWGGALAAFPAMFLTTFIILCRAYGCEYSTVFAKNTPIGLFGVIPYLWGVHYFYPSQGLIYGTIISYALSISITCVVYLLTNAPLKKNSCARIT